MRVGGIVATLLLHLPLSAASQETTPADPAQARPSPAAPFAFADFSWVPGNYGSSDRPLSFGPFTGELRVDTAFHRGSSTACGSRSSRPTGSRSSRGS